MPEFTPSTTQELSEFLQANAAGERQAFQIVGGGTALEYGCPLSKPVTNIFLKKLNRVIDYPTRDMTITVEAGMTIAELTKTLRAEIQELPIDVPDPKSATVGGILACDVSGPRRFGHGTLRDFLIGVTAVDGLGRTFHAGGRVVKNVAGYDLCKLLIGSFGTLAVITEATFKVQSMPVPMADAWELIGFDDLSQCDAAIANLSSSACRPVAVEVVNQKAARMMAEANEEPFHSTPWGMAVMIEGSEADVHWQCRQLQSEWENLDGRVLHPLRDYRRKTWPPVKPQSTVRVTLPPSKCLNFLEVADAMDVALSAHAGDGVVIGVLPNDSAPSLVQQLREKAHELGGRLTVELCPSEWKKELSVFDQSESTLRLMREIKSKLDPYDVLNPGRLFS
ncbi:FAD-binding oxidoreductase [Thalassoroseus pseudoceratinae]|uniref:FAD-binding oxidoreductase n=1 Tax=Thalassoroseus pseudoceratinae TaxID=2713176 RepID=UPI0014203E31|nr:FAD-binding oxidoreductase [Thalassoroseus pseudoceratinae]